MKFIGRSASFEIHTRPENLIKIMCINLLTLQANCGAHINIATKQPTSTNVEYDVVSPYCRFIASILGLCK